MMKSEEIETSPISQIKEKWIFSKIKELCNFLFKK